MLTVIIADDEINICSLICSLVDWEALDLKLIGEAHSGTQARELIFREKPDIAILDIRMPGVDGLEIVREAHAAGLGTKFLLVSGHKNFEYAHTAIKYGVERYLLKPIKREELQENLFQISEQIHADREDQIVINRMKVQLARNADFNRKYLLHSLCEGEPLKELDDLELVNRTYDTHFQSGTFQIAVLHLNGRTSYDPSQVDMLLNRIREHFDASISGDFYDVLSMKQRCDVAVLINGRSREQILQAMTAYFEQAWKKWYPYGNLSVAVSSPAENLTSLRPEEAMRASFRRMSGSTNHVIEYTAAGYERISLRNADDQKAFINSFDALNAQPVNEWLDRRRDKILNPRVEDYDLFQDFLWISEHLINERLRGFLSEEDFRARLNQDEFALRCAGTRRELLDVFFRIFQNGLNSYVSEQKQAGSKYIQQAKQYISEHYAENVALEDIARVAFVNPVYLSILFKKEEGINFSDYLMRYRIEKAKELLRSGRKYNLDQISAMVGYQDTRYFSKLFTRLVGIKPSDYRRLY